MPSNILTISAHSRSFLCQVAERVIWGCKCKRNDRRRFSIGLAGYHVRFNQLVTRDVINNARHHQHFPSRVGNQNFATDCVCGAVTSPPLVELGQQSQSRMIWSHLLLKESVRHSSHAHVYFADGWLPHFENEVFPTPHVVPFHRVPSKWNTK